MKALSHLYAATIIVTTLLEFSIHRRIWGHAALLKDCIT